MQHRPARLKIIDHVASGKAGLDGAPPQTSANGAPTPVREAPLKETARVRAMLPAVLRSAHVQDEMQEQSRARILAGALIEARQAAPAMAATATGETIAEYATRWLDAREARGISSIRDDRGRMRDHILPILGPHRVDESKTDLAAASEQVVAYLDDAIATEEMAFGTAANVWTLVTTMGADMAHAKPSKFELRVRPNDDPFTGIRGPEGGVELAKQYLFPFSAFVHCADVPLHWRRLVAVAIYLGARSGELRALDWERVDLEHKIVTIDRAWNNRTKKIETTKTENVRHIPIHPNLLPLLRAMHDEAMGDGQVLREMPAERTLARGFRRRLRRAGIKREALFEGTKTSRPIRFHDTRSTFATWWAIVSLDPLKIMQRGGWSAIEMVMVYVREAEALREGFGEPFPALTALVSVDGKGETVDGNVGGVDGTRTRGLRRDRPAL